MMLFTALPPPAPPEPMLTRPDLIYYTFLKAMMFSHALPLVNFLCHFLHTHKPNRIYTIHSQQKPYTNITLNPFSTGLISTFILLII